MENYVIATSHLELNLLFATSTKETFVIISHIAHCIFFQLKKQTSDTMMWHSKVGKLQEKLDEQTKKNNTMERYVADLPTKENRQELATQV